MTREELVSSQEYWCSYIQNELFNRVIEYMESEGLNRKQLADKLGVSKGYITQIMNGDFDHKLSKLVELSLMTGKAPILIFEDLETFTKNTSLTVEEYLQKRSAAENNLRPRRGKQVHGAKGNRSRKSKEKSVKVS